MQKILSAAGMEKGHAFKDILRHILGEPLPKRKHQGRMGDVRIGDIMSSPAITTRPEEDIRKAADLLESKRIKRLPVVDSDNRLLGIISMGDIIRAMSKK